MSAAKKNVLLLLVIFLISIIVRLSNIDRPLSFHHEWLTAFSLRVVSILYDGGAAQYNFNPIANYNGDANKNIDNTSVLFMPKNQQGDYYYISYPPFGYLLPYFIFKLISLKPTILGIQILNLCLHFIGAYFIFLIISLLSLKNNQKINWPGVIGFGIYTFLPLNLWFQSNVYSPETLIQTIFIIEAYILFKILFSKQIGNYYWWLLGIFNFLAVYTEWLGILLAGTICLYALFKAKDKKYKTIFYIVMITSLLALMLTVYQYSLISGLHDLLVIYENKYLLRSGFSSLSENNTSILEIRAWLKLTETYVINFIPFFLSSVPFLYLLFRGKSREGVLNKNFLTAAYIIIIPIILHHVLFFNGTVVHDFFLLKDSIYIAIFGALFYWYYFEYLAQKNQFKYRLSIFLVIVIFLATAMIIYNQPNQFYSSQYKAIGEKIRMTSSNEEVVFINFENSDLKQIDIEPQQIIYAQRNIARWQDDNQAEKLIRLNGLNRGVIFNINHNFDVFSIDHIKLKD
jgi:hypothetical protein